MASQRPKTASQQPQVVSPPPSRRISNILAIGLETFATIRFQGHLSPWLTPDFAKDLASTIHPLNQKVFAPLHLSDEQLNFCIAMLNVIMVATLLSQENRKIGFLVNGAFYAVMVYANSVIGEPIQQPAILIGMSALGYLLR